MKQQRESITLWVILNSLIPIVIIGTGLYIFAQVNSESILITIIQSILGVGAVPTFLTMWQIYKTPQKIPLVTMPILQTSVKLSRVFMVMDIIAVLVAILLIISVIPGLPKPWVVVVPLATATSIPLATATSIPSPYGGKLLFNDPLNTASSRWDENINCTFTNNAYHVHSEDPLHLFQDCAEYGDVLSNAAFQVQITLIQGSVGGIIFRNIDHHGCYYFSIGWDGKYMFQRINTIDDANHVSYTIFHSQVTPNSQHTYTLKIVADNSSFKAFINNTSYSLPDDHTYTSGHFFLCVGPYGATTTHAIYSNLTVWTL